MYIESEHIADLGIDTGTISFFAVGKIKRSRQERALSHLTRPTPGHYNVYIREQDDRPSEVHIILQDHSQHILGSEIHELKYLGTIPIQNRLLITDPCYVHSNTSIDPEPLRYALCVWGGNIHHAREWLVANSIAFQQEEDGDIRIDGDDPTALSILSGRLKDDMTRQTNGDLKLGIWLKDTANLFEKVTLDYTPRTMNYTRKGKTYAGVVITPTGHGDGIYALKAYKCSGDIVGFNMAFSE
jgi:hypothetical protein